MLNSNFRLRLPKLLSALILCAALSRAGVITIDQTLTLDPSLVQPGCGGCTLDGYTQTLTQTPFTVQAGYTVTGTVTFTNGPVHLQSTSQGELVMLQFLTDDPSATSFSFNLNFLGLMGDPVEMLPGTGFGGGFAAEQVTSLPVDFSFTGFTYSIKHHIAEPWTNHLLSLLSSL